jgi:hypothetical protein
MAQMETVILAIVLGTGAFYVAKQGRGAMRSAVGWSARQMGWLASQVKSSLDETRDVARAQYERGRVDGDAPTVVATSSPSNSSPSNGDGSAHASAHASTPTP